MHSAHDKALIQPATPAWGAVASMALCISALIAPMGLSPAMAGQVAGPELRSTSMQIKRNGEQSSQKGPDAWFTGQVRIDPLHMAPEPARVGSASVTFEPGARTAWHTHPLGQTLIIVSGTGWVQREGGPVEEVRPGDVVWFPPGVRHWHGATPTNAMTHIAIQESLDGKAVDWLEKVSDEQYVR
ncbi:cupin [Skermanella stibiiresistens SB22]|uniref:Cupin n=2 Tax=Skermanella TaxID=204447 RepID=W9GRB4_9PROT|nr:cupin [Skermanella stibiiresistens SB22]